MENPPETDLNSDTAFHTLGATLTQAARGNHIHDGFDSPKLLDGVTLTGAKGGSVVITSIVAALVQLGATDSTT